MLVANVGDLHIGVRNGSKTFLEFQKKYFEQELFPLLLDKKIKHVIQYGDMLDSRKRIDFYTSKFLYETFIPFFEKNKITLHSIVGNHDMFFRQSTEIVGIKQLTDSYKYIKIYDKPETLIFGDTAFHLLPWVCADTEQSVSEFITQTEKHKFDICCGHLELSGFLVHKGYTSTSDCVNREALDKYDVVLSGHYHSSSTNGKIHYIGTPYQLTWADVDDEKHILIYDTDTYEFEQINTEMRMYNILDFSETQMQGFDFSKYIHGFLKIVVRDKSISNASIDIFLSKLEEKCEPTSVQVLDERNNEHHTDVDIHSTVDDPYTVLQKTISTMQEPDISEKAQSFAHKFYLRCLEESNK